MNDFTRWLCDDAPVFIQVLSIFITTMVFCFALVVSLAMLAIGHWLTPLVVWVVLPPWLVIREYAKSKKGNSNE